MKNHRLLWAVTLANLGLFSYQVLNFGGANAAGESVLRGTGIEIVDRQGRLRAQIKVEPANPRMALPDGKTGYPETVIFRLMTADGKPRVKLTTSEETSALMLLGATDTTHTILKANRDETSLRLRNNEATQELLKPDGS